MAIENRSVRMDGVTVRILRGLVIAYIPTSDGFGNPSGAVKCVKYPVDHYKSRTKETKIREELFKYFIGLSELQRED